MATNTQGRRRRSLSCTRSIAILLFTVASACGQTSRGAVTGRVLDPSNSVIKAATIELTAAATGARFSAMTNGDGIYRFDAVDPGAYVLSVTHPGFRSYSASGIPVEANLTTTCDVRLQLGAVESRIEVTTDAGEVVNRDDPLRGGNFRPRDVQELPLISLDPLSLARTLPGTTDALGSKVWSGAADNGGGFSVNGQRPRGNNYLIDGVDNNEVWISGEEQVFRIADAVAEVSVQTANFGVEFGRATGGVFNIVTKSGTNQFHGSVLWRYQSQAFDSVSNLDKRLGIRPSIFNNNIFGFTAGGPIQRNKTFFFLAFQQDDQHSEADFPIQIPTATAVGRLTSLFPSNPRLGMYLGALGALRGTAAPFDVGLGVDPQTGTERGSVQFATGAYALPSVDDGPQLLVRIDHFQSEKRRLSWRYTYDSRHISPATGSLTVPFPGFIQQDVFAHHGLLFSDSYALSSSYTNEFRFSFSRPDVTFAETSATSVPQAVILPAISIENVARSDGLLGWKGKYLAARFSTFPTLALRATG